MKYGDVIDYNGCWHAVANVDRYGVWLISLEHKDATPYLALPRNAQRQSTGAA